MISWEQPKQVMSKEEWKSISADGAPAGVYIPNMSEADKLLWKGKIIRGGKNPRVEIRKTSGGVQALIVVYPNGDTRISANGKLVVKADELTAVLNEARMVQARF